MSDLGFTKYKSRFAVTWSLTNLRRTATAPSVSMLGRPFEGLTVYVAGAGPSLARNVEQLKGRGPIVTVNSASPALEAAGVVPDVLVARESLDLTDQIEASKARLVACDVSAHPDNWTAAGDRLAWFIPAYPRQIDIAFMLREVPVFGGPATLCSAVELTRRWGAARIVLVGCDMAFAPDGVAYDSRAARGGLRYDFVGEGEARRIQFSGDEQDDERCKRSGQMPPPKTVRFTEVMSSDWSQVLPTINVLQEQRQWLSTLADRYGPEVDMLNATEGGAGVPGWRTVRLAECEWQQLPPVEFDMSGRVDPRDVDACREWVMRGAVATEQAAREMLSPHGPDLGVLASIDRVALGSPMAEALAAHKVIEVWGDPQQRLEQTYTAFRDSSAEAQKIVGG